MKNTEQEAEEELKKYKEKIEFSTEQNLRKIREEALKERKELEKKVMEKDRKSQVIGYILTQARKLWKETR